MVCGKMMTVAAAVLIASAGWTDCAGERTFPAAAADRTVRVDSEGVMRWTDDGTEVAVFGVNYYTPFALDYRVIGERGHDRRETIRRDVAHFRRLGFTAIRLHCFDREISTREGALVDNDHLDLLDFLIAECASNGIYTVLTPIAAWGGGPWTSATEGFAYPVTMPRLTSDPALRAVQARYEEEFASHRNRYTGRRYADDPAVLAFELINEPAYTNGTTDAEIAAFANALLDGIRRSGTTKPVFYSATWNKHDGCVPALRTDGVTGVYYATGLRAGSALRGPQLQRVSSSSLKPDPRLAGKAKIVYEFDAADMSGAYMYPAMAAVFRSEGVQSATQFQYDPTPIADSNDSYMTHYLNLVYTPEKAISMAIAAEVFRRVPRSTPYRPDRLEVSFPPFRVNAARNLSEMVTETALYYTATPMTAIPDPAKLRHVWGCGASPVAASTGTGAYFLDRVGDGLWRLQVYPSVLPVADPYTGLPGKKTIVRAEPPELHLRLPDLGGTYSAFAVTDGACAGRATAGRLTLAPGDYVLSREAAPAAERLASARAADIPAYSAPPPDPPGDYRPWPIPPDELAADIRARYPSRDAVNLLVRPVRLQAHDFVVRDFHSERRLTDVEPVVCAFPSAGPVTDFVISGRALAGRAERIELVLSLSDGSAWGLEVTLPEHPAEIRIPVTAFRHFKHWDDLPDPQKGTKPDLRKLFNVTISFGAWLDKSAVKRAHGIEVGSVRIR